MGLKKTLGIISIFVIAMFALMMSSSYAWYSFNNASTTFNTKTSGDDIKVVYRDNSYISTITAVPISNSEINDKADSNSFSVEVNNDNVEDAMAVSIKLTSVSIDNGLKNSSFKYELLYNGDSVAKGDFSNITGDEFKIIDGITLDNLRDNDFVFRVYLLDDGSNQNEMMNKTFRGIISVNVISRVKVELDKQNIDFAINDITIDGKKSDSLPSSGRYTMNSVCEKGSNISWDATKRILIYEAGSVIGDKCSFTFTKDTNYPSLYDTAISGDYVKYTANNGCSGKSCSGNNANYVSDKDMGYCSSNDNKYITSGYRVMYSKDNSVYIVSAGALECINDNTKLDNIALKYCNNKLVSNGECDSNNVRSINEEDIKLINKNNNDCYNKKSDTSCGYNNDLIDNGGYYWVNNNDNILLGWNPKIRGFDNNMSIGNYGVRPVIHLDSNVYIVSGNGTYDDPYILGK